MCVVPFFGFFGVFGAFRAFSAFVVFCGACVFCGGFGGLLWRSRRWWPFSAFATLSVVAAFSALVECQFAFWFRPCPAHFSTGPVMMVLVYFFYAVCVFRPVYIIMIASGSLAIDICFKVSWGDRWGAEPRSVRWSGGLRFG